MSTNLSTKAYTQIETALRYLAEHSGQQPSLTELAQATGVSEFHLHRQFVAWAGLTPKEFLQYLTAGRAKQLLAESHSVLETSLAVGLSGSSRLHDLMIDIESLTPGEYKAQALGIDIDWSLADTPFGTAVFAATRRGLCLISFVDNVADAEAELATRWPQARYRESPAALQPHVDELNRRMHGQSPQQRLGVMLCGSPLRLKVWSALMCLPYGKLASYTDVARVAGVPLAVRAVASAVGDNPIAWLIPCHRVIRATGALGEYRWGTQRKRVIAAYECLNVG